MNFVNNFILQVVAFVASVFIFTIVSVAVFLNTITLLLALEFRIVKIKWLLVGDVSNIGHKVVVDNGHS